MAQRTRKKADTAPADDTSFNPADFESSDPTAQPPVNDSTPPAEPERSFASGHIANPSSTRRESFASSVAKPLPSTLGISAGDMKVQLIDKGDNAAGIGIRVVFPEDAEGRPTAEEKEIIRSIVKAPNGQFPSGYTWKNDFGMWHKEIGRETPKHIAGAIRYDAENRVEKLADALRMHAADPAGYADMIKTQREQAAQRDQIPD